MNMSSKLAVGRDVQDRPTVCRDVSGKLFFLDSSLEEVLRVPLPGATLPTAGSATESGRLWWPATDAAHPLLLPDPGVVVLSDAGARAWCASMIMAPTELHDFMNDTNADLIQELAQAILGRSWTHITIHHVRSHQYMKETPDKLLLFMQLGNDEADRHARLVWDEDIGVHYSFW